jgi:hypothetical protein
MECQYCKTVLANKYNLDKHIKTSKKCFKIRGKVYESPYVCKFCNYVSSCNTSLKKHLEKCNNKKSYIESEVSNKNLLEITILNNSLNERIEELEIELEKRDNLIKQIESKDQIIERLVQQLEQKDNTIQKITKKQSRPQIKDQNVIYVLTTPFLENNRTYIIGKATNLTTRLSTYNKTDEHKVVFYKQCKDEHLLTTTETIIIDKLTEYKLNGNRDRITLPNNIDISMILDIINNVIKFVNE